MSSNDELPPNWRHQLAQDEQLLAGLAQAGGQLHRDRWGTLTVRHPTPGLPPERENT